MITLLCTCCGETYKFIALTNEVSNDTADRHLIRHGWQLTPGIGGVDAVCPACASTLLGHSLGVR